MSDTGGRSMRTKIQLYHCVGWSLIGVAALLLIFCCVQILQGDPTSILTLIPISLLLFGFLGIPGIIVLKRRWGDLSSIISGFICLALYAMLIAHIDKLAALVITGKSPVLDMIGALFHLLPLILPLWLHKLLRPKLQSILEAKK